MQQEELRRGRFVIRVLWVVGLGLWVLTALAQFGEALIKVVKAWRSLPG